MYLLTAVIVFHAFDPKLPRFVCRILAVANCWWNYCDVCCRRNQNMAANATEERDPVEGALLLGVFNDRPTLGTFSPAWIIGSQNNGSTLPLALPRLTHLWNNQYCIMNYWLTTASDPSGTLLMLVINSAEEAILLFCMWVLEMRTVCQAWNSPGNTIWFP